MCSSARGADSNVGMTPRGADSNVGVTPFSFEHDFAAPSASVVFAAYFDPAHQVEPDHVLGIVEREVQELVDRDDELYRRCRIVPRRQLPALFRPFAAGALHYI